IVTCRKVYVPTNTTIERDFFLFPRLKVWLGGQKFSSNEVIASVDAYFAKQDAQYYLNGLKGWEHHSKKCIDLKGDYVEK
ncbi:hypothetical protein ALC60_04727, partial [Trachymyrmex zeteki]